MTDSGMQAGPSAPERRLEPASPVGVPSVGGRQSGPAWDRLQDQLSWYGRKSAHHKDWFQRLKVIQIVIAAAIPVGAGAGVPASAVGALGALIVVLEGLQQLFQFQQNWVSYRATAEALKHEQLLYVMGGGPYAGTSRPDILLAERVEGLVSQEHSAWSSMQRDIGRRTSE
jgi:hypothetical protein